MDHRQPIESDGDAVQFDHVMFAVHDPGPLIAELADEWGLHVHADAADFNDGVSNLIVPLQPPQYFEVLYVRDADAFATADDQALIETLGGGGGLVGVVLRTPNLAAVSEQLHQPPISGPGFEGSPSPPWRFVSRAGQRQYPVYIEYQSATPQQRLERWQQRLVDAAHSQLPGGIAWLEVHGAVEDLRAWLAPARQLDIRIREGTPSATVAISVGDRTMVLSTTKPGLNAI